MDSRPTKPILKAYARINGSSSYHRVSGTVKFYQSDNCAVYVEAEIFGLPTDKYHHSPCFFGFHLHENGDCGNDFEDTGGHYNPYDLPHPMHLGDFPPLISSDGYAWMCFYDGSLTINEIMDRSVIIHANADDFTSQPSGSSGVKIACGVVCPTD